jgi:hypothetical protein
MITRRSFWTRQQMLFGWSNEEAWDGRDSAAVCMRFLNWSVAAISHLSHPFYMSHPPHVPRFGHLNHIWKRANVITFLATRFSPSSCWFLSLGSKYSPWHPVHKQHEPMSFRQSNKPYLTPILIRKQAGLKICILILRFKTRVTNCVGAWILDEITPFSGYAFSKNDLLPFYLDRDH